jgi:predicted phosphate transport protein (TIGR00153 family)
MPINSILDVFAKSPLKPLMQHIDTVKMCSETLMPLFEAARASDWDEAQTQRDQICKLEEEADALKHKLRKRMPSGIFMPVERTDMLALLHQQDKIANKAKDISGHLIGRQMQLPKVLESAFIAYLQRCLDAVAQAHEAIHELNGLLESGFRGREIEIVAKMIENLDKIEDDTDAMQIQLRQELFKIEAQLNPVDVLFLYKIIDWVGGLADLAEGVGSRLEIMLARA